jgi:hypothetical protein
MDSWETLNTKIPENFVTFLTVGRTQNFNLGYESYGRLKLGSITSYDFLVLVNFKFVFNLFFKVQINHAYAYAKS